MESHEQEDRSENNALTSVAFSLIYQQGYRDQGIVVSGVKISCTSISVDKDAVIDW